MKKKKYLEFYKECLKSGKLPERGLCGSLGGGVEIFVPTNKEFGVERYAEFYYWGYNGENTFNKGDIKYRFTPLRQTIVLFLAAMNGEL